VEQSFTWAEVTAKPGASDPRWARQWRSARRACAIAVESPPPPPHPV